MPDGGALSTDDPRSVLGQLVWRIRYRIVFGAALVLYLFLSLHFYLGAGRDDVFISMWVGEAMAEGHGFVNHNLERVEICTSLLHALVLAFFAKYAPGHVFTLNKLAGLVCGGAVLSVLHTYRGALLADVKKRQFAAYLAMMLLVSTNPGFLYWNLGGLETPFVTLLFALYAAQVAAHWQRPTIRAEVGIAIAAALYALARPEGLFLVLFGAIYVALFYWFTGWRSSLLIVVLIPAVTTALVMVWRYSYFGQCFPNPVYAKTGPLIEAVQNGLTYFGQFYTASLFLTWSLGVAAALFVHYAALLWRSLDRDLAPRLRNRLNHLSTLGLVVAVNLVVVLAGGDWMEHFRFFAPEIPLLVVISVVTGFRLFSRVFGAAGSPRARRVALTVGITLLMTLAVSNAKQSDLNVPRPLAVRNVSNIHDYALSHVFADLTGLDQRLILLNRDHEREFTLLEPFLKETLPRLYREHGHITIATGQMGCFPYLIKKRFPQYNLYFVDHLGLCDKTVSRMPLPKDHIGLTHGRFTDEVIAGMVPILSDYVRSKKPQMLYMLGFVADMDERVERLRRCGYDVIFDDGPEKVFFNPDP